MYSEVKENQILVNVTYVVQLFPEVLSLLYLFVQNWVTWSWLHWNPIRGNGISINPLKQRNICASQSGRGSIWISKQQYPLLAIKGLIWQYLWVSLKGPSWEGFLLDLENHVFHGSPPCSLTVPQSPWSDQTKIDLAVGTIRGFAFIP